LLVPDMSVLRLEHVWKAFDRGRERVPVLEDVSFSVAAGTIAAVVGARAQGKTTLLRVASGTLPADRGAVVIEGFNVTGTSDGELGRVLARSVGLATRSGPRARLTVRQYVEMSLTATHEYGPAERVRCVDKALDRLELTGCADLKWDELSDWERVATEFAQATIVRPKLLLVDDVVDGLGLGRKQLAMELLEDFAQELRCGVLMAVSDHAAALRSSQVWQLSNGKLKLMHRDPDVIDLHQERRGRAG
jgi:ABC-type cobalamin/Fe3+-siderophores transport system ATPase subunit